MDAISGSVDGIWVPFEKTDVCQSITPKCPLSAGTTALFNFDLTISNYYPTVSDKWTLSALLICHFQNNVLVKSNITDNGGSGVCICFEIKGKIV